MKAKGQIYRVKTNAAADRLRGQIIGAGGEDPLIWVWGNNAELINGLTRSIILVDFSWENSGIDINHPIISGELICSAD